MRRTDSAARGVVEWWGECCDDGGEHITPLFRSSNLQGSLVVFGLIVLSFVLLPTQSVSQPRKPASIAELSTYGGSDRDQLLYTGAKTEGTVAWYTSLAGDSYKAVARAFETKYAGVRIEAYRAGGTDLVVRIGEEAKARRLAFDVLETTREHLMMTRASNFLRAYFSPQLARYPDAAKERADKGLAFWTVDRESYNGFGYNKSQLSAAVPKGFDGLLHPELRGKLGIAFGESANKAIGAMVKIKGEGFVRKLKAQEIKVYTVSSAALVDLIASGEIGASFHIYRNHALVSMDKGSPVGWLPMEIAFTNSGAVALAAQPPHPHGALLLIDFLLGDGQKVLEKFQYGQPYTDYGFKRWYPEAGLSVGEYEKQDTKWEKLVKEITQR
jgi:iron(III) transport system substrate-binding protein